MIQQLDEDGSRRVVLPVRRLGGSDSEIEGYARGYVTSRIFKGSASGSDKWRWQYRAHPFADASNPSVWICVQDGKTVGHLGAIPVDLKIGEGRLRAAWAVDFETAQEYRRRGIGQALTETAAGHFDVFLSVGNTDMSFNLFKKMGWRFLGDIPCYVKIWDARPWIERKTPSPFIVGLVSPIANAVLALGCAFFKPVRGNVSIRKIERFGAESDALWDRIGKSFSVMIPRDRRYLNWKYDDQPGMSYVKFEAFRGEKIAGYIVVRVVPDGRGGREGLIADMIADPADQAAIRCLVSGGCAYLRSTECAGVRCYATHESLKRALNRSGFMKRRTDMRFMVYAAREIPSGLTEPADWFITAGDSDIDR